MTSVSFVIPVYNKARHLPEVLAAIAAQKGDFNREYIFVDDGSSDNSLEILHALTAGWTNVTIIPQSNHGSAHATNTGIRAAAMDFIKFVDADDLLHQQATALLLDALARNPDAGLAYALRHEFNDGETLDLTHPVPPYALTRMEHPLHAAIQNSLFNPTQFLARTALVKQSGGCDERVRHSQEYSLTLRLARLAPFVRVETVLAFFNRGEPNRHGKGNNRQLQRVNLALALFLEDYPDTPADLQRHACRRATGRAWKFQQRHRNAGVMTPLFWQKLTLFTLRPGQYAPAIRKTLPVFDEAKG